MPTPHAKNISSVPPPSRVSRRSRAKQMEYNTYVKMLDETEVVDLELEEGDESRAIKMSLHQAGKRLGIELDVWDANGHVYFRRSHGTKRGRPRSFIDLTRNISNEGS